MKIVCNLALSSKTWGAMPDKSGLFFCPLHNAVSVSLLDFPAHVFDDLGKRHGYFHGYNSQII